MRTIAQYPHDFSAHFGDNHLAHKREVNKELPGVDTYDPMAIDIIAMLLWLDKKYGLDDNNQIVFEIWEGKGLRYLTDFLVNVTFCDRIKEEAAQHHCHAWEEVIKPTISEEVRQHCEREMDRLEATLYTTESEILFKPPRFKVSKNHRRFKIPKLIANTKRTIHVVRVPQNPGANIAYTIRPNGTRVHVP